jgi:hypothetical protein
MLAALLCPVGGLGLTPSAAAVPASAPRAACVLRLDGRSVGPGETHVLVGAGFRAGEPVDVSPGGAAAQHATTDASGAFTITLHVPAALDGPFWAVAAASADSVCSVHPPVTPRAARRPPAAQLATVGCLLIAGSVVGVFLAACALLFLTVGRRRRS